MDVAAINPMFKILYLIPHYPQDLNDHSVFGWYTPALHQAAGSLELVATLPADIRELSSEPDVVLRLRLARRIWPNIIPVELDALLAGFNDLAGRFRVFVSDDQAIANEIDTLISQTGSPCLHISWVEGAGRIHVRDFNLSLLANYCNAVLDSLASDSEWTAFVHIARAELQKPLRSWRIHSLLGAQHNVTKPNEKALEAFGWKIQQVDPLASPTSLGALDPQRYVNRICESANAVVTARSELMKGMRPQLRDYRYVVAVQSMYWGHFNEWRRKLSNHKDVDRKVLNIAFGSAVQATTYFDMFEKEELKLLLDNPAFHYVQSQRAKDAYSFTAGLTVLATATLAPVLRLEPKLNQIRGDLKQFAKCARARAHHHFDWKQSRMARKLSEKMRSLINPSFLELIDEPEKLGPIEGLKLVADLPLELMASRGLPLSMRFDISRLAVLPGNLYLQNCLMRPVIVSLQDFSEVLVIRSFHPDDPLRELLEEAISSALEASPESSTFNVSLRYVDVFNEDDFVQALQGFNGALMIFDGHGSYDKDLGSGTIVIGGAEVELWQLRARCSLPPIVVFSACDTQPLDGSHSSVATAAFTLGAHTVLATTLPIDGRKAGAFIGRLLLRIAEFLPLAAKHQTLLTWREVISGMLRMSHVTEVMLALKKDAGPAYHYFDFEMPQFRANIAINQRRSNWYEEFLDELSRCTGKTTDELTHDIELWASMTDSMKYVQLGNPESIVIVEEHPDEIFQREARTAFGDEAPTQHPVAVQHAGH